MSFSLNGLRTRLYTNTWFKAGMWSVVVLLVILTIAGLGANLGKGAGARAVVQPNEVIANIEGHDITRAEFNQAMDVARKQARRAIDPAQSADVNSSILGRIAMMKLQVQEAKDAKLTVSNADLNKAREDVLTQNRVRESLGLKPTASIAEVDDALAKAGGKSIEERLPDAELTEELLVQKLQKQNDDRIVATELDARDSYKQWHTRHILIDNKKRSDDQAKVQAQQILDKAKAPKADFAALAKQYSDDPGTKAKGGDDGWIDQNTSYVPEFKKAAFALTAGQITPELVKSDAYGYFIIKVDEQRQNIPKDFDKNKAKYISDVQNQKKQDAQKATFDRLTAETKKMMIKDPQLRADFTMVDAKATTDVAQKEAKYRAALVDYQTALKSAAFASDAAGINAEMGAAYEALHQIPQAIDAYNLAIKSAPSPTVEVALGNIYLDQKNNAKALENFQQATKDAWDDPNIHQQAMAAYRKLGRNDLVAVETAWQGEEQKRQQAQQEAMMKQYGISPQQMGGAKPAISVAPPAGGAKPAISVNPSTGGAKATATPASQEYKVVMPKEKGGKPVVTLMPSKPGANVSVTPTPAGTTPAIAPTKPTQ